MHHLHICMQMLITADLQLQLFTQSKSIECKALEHDSEHKMLGTYCNSLQILFVTLAAHYHHSQFTIIIGLAAQTRFRQHAFGMQ